MYSKILLTLLTLLLSTSLTAQLPQSWKSHCDSTFVFEINNKQAEKLLREGGSDKLMQELLRTPVATFVGKWESMPEQGHYIYVNINQNQIYFRYAPIIPFQVFLFREYGLLTLQVIDADGKIRQDAKVRIQPSKWRFFDTLVDFDKTSQTYTIDDWSEKTERILTVELDKFKAVFDLHKYIVRAQYDYNNNYYDDDDSGPSFYSYMITDKNKYKPGETVRFKSYALTGNKRPIKEDLEVLVSTPKHSYKKIADIKPYNPGGFAGEILLHDSLELRLDNHYTLQLRDKKGRFVAGASFRYEDYELFDNKLESQLSQTIQYFPDTNYVEIKVTDANGLIIPNMKAEIITARGQVFNSYEDLIVLPEIIRHDTVSLNNDQTTRYPIFSDWMGNADGQYSVYVGALTPDGKPLQALHNATFYKSHYNIRHHVTDSIIHFEFFELGKSQPVDALLYIDNTVPPIAIQLPHSEPFKQSVKEYRVYVPEYKTSTNINNGEIHHGISIEGGIVKGSLKLTMLNPRGLEVSWYVYESNRLLEKGFGKEISFEQAYINLDLTYYLEIFYTVGNQDMVFRKTYAPQKEYLNVDMDLPDRIYPGQTVNSTIKVTDSRGRNVKDVDLTAFSFNTQLDYHVPDLPYYGNTPKGREQRSSFSINKRNVTHTSNLTQKNFDFWNVIADLEKMDYYRFTFPNPKLYVEEYNPDAIPLPHHDLFKYTIDTPDGTTEFAPYVMLDGQKVTIHVIELDNVPVYFSWTNQPRAYSFLSTGGRHKIMLRLHDRAIILERFLLEPGKKTILSLNLNDMPKSMHIRTVMLDTRTKHNNYRYQLTSKERESYGKYISELPVNADRYVYLQKDSVWFRKNDRYPVYYPGFLSYRKNVLVGPLDEGYYRYMDGVRYLHEGGFSYQYSDNVVYKYPADIYPAELWNYANGNFDELSDFHFTSAEFNRRIGDKPTEANKWFPGVIHLPNTKIHVPADKDKTGIHSLIMRDKETGKVFVTAHKQRIVSSNNNSTYLYGMDKMNYGHYDVFLLYNSGKFLRYNDVPLLKGSYTELKMTKCEEHPQDSISAEWLAYEIYTTKQNYNYDYTPSSYIDRQPEYWNRFKSSTFNPANDIRGEVVDETGEAIIGASIYIKDQTIGTVSDIDGKFVLDLHGRENTLMVSFLGFETQEIKATRGSTIKIVMKESAVYLEEVVVTGYGAQRRSSLTGAISGVMAGIVSSEPTGSIPEEEIEDSEDAQSESAEDKLYQELLILNGLRTNFSDIGFWEPALVTNRKGEASFSVTFPDNITSWQAVVYAMNRKLKTGTARKTIKSYKPIMAELKTPSFLVVGDSSYFSSNIRNYTKDPEISGRINFVSNGDTLQQADIHFLSSYPDYLQVEAPETDSLTVSYLFTRDDGYSDGEQRSIPIEKQGTEIADGTFRILRNNDEISIAAKPNEEVHISITGKQIDVYMDAANYLKGYKYACNEQLASKLIGLLNYRLYQQFIGKEFRHDKEVNELIERLLKNQNGDRLWSWWGNNSATSFWMSAHILRALHLAKQSGYTVNLNIKKTNYDYMDVQAFKHTSLSDIDILSVLADWETEQNYEAAIELFEKTIAYHEAVEDSLVNINKSLNHYESRFYKRSYLREKLLLIEMRQKLGMDYDREFIANHLETDVFGNVQIVDSMAASRNWYYNNDMTNLIAYRIIRNDYVLKHHLDGMQMHILGTKRFGWNTYQAASALLTVMPDLLSMSASKDQLAKVNISGTDNQVLTAFPYETTLQGGEHLTIKKETGIPLIYSAYTILHRTKEHLGDAFEVTTYIPESTLKKGVSVTMRVKVTVKQDNAEHVMIEVPIPAGCSYNSKLRGYGYEVYREYFKEKTVIFCERLPKGEYTYSIDLLPRYSGSYIINPAKVEMMYFPVINANNDMRKITISNEK